MFIELSALEDFKSLAWTCNSHNAVIYYVYAARVVSVSMDMVQNIPRYPPNDSKTICKRKPINYNHLKGGRMEG